MIPNDVARGYADLIRAGRMDALQWERLLAVLDPTPPSLRDKVLDACNNGMSHDEAALTAVDVIQSEAAALPTFHVRIGSDLGATAEVVRKADINALFDGGAS